MARMGLPGESERDQVMGAPLGFKKNPLKREGLAVGDAPDPCRIVIAIDSAVGDRTRQARRGLRGDAQAWM